MGNSLARPPKRKCKIIRCCSSASGYTFERTESGDRKILTHARPQQRYSQQPKGGSNLEPPDGGMNKQIVVKEFPSWLSVNEPDQDP